MTTFVAFRLPVVSGKLVFEKPLNPGGTTTPLVLSTTENSTVSLASVFPKLKTLTTLQQSQITLKRVGTNTLSAIQTSLLDVITDTTLAGALTTVNQNSTVSGPVKQDQPISSTTQSSVATVDLVINLGSSHSTFFIELDTNQISTAAANKALQVIKSKNTSSTVTLARANFGAQTYDIELDTTQTSTVSVNNSYTMTLSVTNQTGIPSITYGPFTGPIITVGSGVSGPGGVSDYNASGVTRKVEILTPIGGGFYTIVEDSDVTGTKPDDVVEEWNVQS